MGGNKSKSVVYTISVPGSEELEYSAVLRHPDAHEIIVKPQILECDNYYALLQKFAINNPKKPFLGRRASETSNYEWMNYSYCLAQINSISHNMSMLDFHIDQILSSQFHKPIALMGFLGISCIEFLLMDIACMNTNIVTVGLFDKIPNFIDWAQELSLKYLCCSASYLLELVELKKEKKMHLELIIVCGDIEESIENACMKVDIRLVYFGDLTKKSVSIKALKIKPNDPYCLSLTSGTTHRPKFCIITHLNLMSTLTSCYQIAEKFSVEDCYLSYMSFSLLGEKIFIFLVSVSGGKIGMARNPTDFREDMRYLKPTMLVTVPKMLEYLYTNIKREVDGLTGLSKSLYSKAFASKIRRFASSGSLRHILWDNLVFKRAQKLMGGSLKVMIVGASSCDKEQIRYLRVILGCYIIEGYGLIESTACSLSTLEYDKGCGYQGGPILNLEARLRNPGFSIDDHAHYYGELCIRGQSISSSYYGTKASTLDSAGWFHTGDLFALIPETGALRFVDRLEYIISSRSSKPIFVSQLEVLYKQCNVVNQILCIGDPRVEGIFAIVVPDFEFIAQQWKQDAVEVCAGSEFKATILREFVVIERIHKLKEHQKVLGVHLELDPWTDEEVITPTLKLKRYVLLKRYESVIETMVKDRLATEY